MKKLFRILVFLALVCLALPACFAALAEDKPLEIIYAGPAAILPGQSAPVLKTKINSLQEGKVTFSLTDTVKKTVVYTETKTDVTPGQEISWAVPYYSQDMSASKPIREMRASFVLDGKAYTYSLFYTFSPKDNSVSVEKASWYYKNTACSFGPYFREERPAMTDKWYTFTPVDLTIQGRQTFEYVASNMYVIGEVYVDVDGDEATVSYHNFYEQQDGRTTTVSEYFTFFPDLDSVAGADLENLSGSMQFDRPVSISRDLAGDTNVLLFVCNHVNYCTYPTATHKLTRFWPNLPEREILRGEMIDLMNR